MESLSTAKQFDDFLVSPSPVAVIFSATWCGPCRNLKAVIEKNKDIFSIPIAIASTDENEIMDIASRSRVSALPTFVLFDSGKEVGRIIGVSDLNHYNKLIHPD